MIKGLVFDFDGLIVDTETPEYHAWVETYRQFGAELTLEEWSQCIGSAPPIFDVVATLKQKSSRVFDGEALKDKVKQSVHQQILNQPVLSGVIERLMEAQEMGIPAMVASSSPHAWVDSHLERLDLRRYFSGVVCRDDVNRAKPYPDLYLLAADRMGILPEQALAFEDSPNGIQAAVAAGIFCFAVPNPVPSFLDVSQASWQLSSLTDLTLKQMIALQQRLRDANEAKPF